MWCAVRACGGIRSCSARWPEIGSTATNGSAGWMTASGRSPTAALVGDRRLDRSGPHTRRTVLRGLPGRLPGHPLDIRSVGELVAEPAPVQVLLAPDAREPSPGARRPINQTPRHVRNGSDRHSRTAVTRHHVPTDPTRRDRHVVGACSRRVENTLNKIDGVHATVDISTKVATIDAPPRHRCRRPMRGC